MTFKSDGGGTAIKLPDCKIGGMNWMTRLSQIGRWPEKKLIISTFSLPDFSETERLFRSRRPYGENVVMLCHSKFIGKARQLKKEFPRMKVYVSDCVHAKLCLFEPRTVWIGSGNFGDSHWFETSLGIHSEELYEHYYLRIQNHIKNFGKEIV